jgi:hypothetical protein
MALKARPRVLRAICLAERATTVSDPGAGADGRISAVLEWSGFGCCIKGRVPLIGVARPRGSLSALVQVLQSRKNRRG